MTPRARTDVLRDPREVQVERHLEVLDDAHLEVLVARYFVEQMNAFKSGARAATVMHQLAKGYNAAQIDRLAAYFAAQKK